MQCSTPRTMVLVGFTVRDRRRELGFLQELCARHFRLREAAAMTVALDAAVEGDVCLVILERLEHSCMCPKR